MSRREEISVGKLSSVTQAHQGAFSDCIIQIEPKTFKKQMLRRGSDEKIYEKFLVIMPPTENGAINGRGIMNIPDRDKVP